MDATDWPACDSGRLFAAIDFETATSQRSSACAVGVVVFNQGSPVDRRRLLIRPPGNRYDAFNTALHGIGPADTGDSPPFPEVWDQVAGMVDGHLVVAHNTAFDMSVLRRSAEHYGYEPEPFPFACTYRLARSAFPEARSWGLKGLAAEFGIPLSHHDPLSDAQAAGHLWLALPERFNTTHPELLALHGYRLGRCDLSAYRSYSNAQPSSRGASSSFSAKDFTPRAEPDPDGLLYATKIAFTAPWSACPGAKHSKPRWTPEPRPQDRSANAPTISWLEQSTCAESGKRGWAASTARLSISSPKAARSESSTKTNSSASSPEQSPATPQTGPLKTRSATRPQPSEIEQAGRAKHGAHAC